MQKAGLLEDCHATDEALAQAAGGGLTGEGVGGDSYPIGIFQHWGAVLPTLSVSLFCAQREGLCHIPPSHWEALSWLAWTLVYR